MSTQKHHGPRADPRLVADARAEALDAPRRVAAVEAIKRRNRAHQAHQAELAARQPAERVLADPGYVVGDVRGGWQQLAERGRYAVADDQRRTRQSHEPRVVGDDPDSRESEVLRDQLTSIDRL